MKCLIVGAGAVGGYFGGRLLEAGKDVTFLVRAGRAAELARDGLVIKSPSGNVTLAAPPFVLAENVKEQFDLIFLTSKAYELHKTMDSFASAVGPQTTILPALNGMRHLDQLAARFGAGCTLGGVALISADRDFSGAIVHLNPLHTLSYGELDGTMSSRVEAIAAFMAGANFDARLGSEILQEMWEKWVFIATAAGITCLMRAAVGDIVAGGGTGATLQLLDECTAIAAGAGYSPRPQFRERSTSVLTTAGSPFTASMLRDLERGAPTEAEHILGDLLSRGGEAVASPNRTLLRTAYTHLTTYEARRIRVATKG